jgi:ABC-2 type transport system permease protein
MKILKLADYLFKSLIRDKSSFFWLLIFPVILLAIMMIIFPPLYETKSVTFDLTLMSHKGMFSEIIERVFNEVSKGENKIFQLKVVQSSEENLKRELENLKVKKTNLIVEIPESFDAQMLNWFMLKNMGGNPPPPSINIYSLRHQASSETAYIIVKNIFQKLELEFIKRIGYKIEEVTSETEIVGTKDTFSFIDFIYPGIVIFVVFMTGLFGIGTDMAWLKEKGIIRRINVTPLPSSNFIISYIISRIYLIILQIILVTLTAKLIFKTTVNPLSPPFIGYSLLTIVCLSSFGFFLASISKTTNSANAISQVLNFPMQFLGGLYFPVTNVPWAIRWIVLINPITYLASGIRDSLGILKSPYSPIITITVPILWTVFCFLFTIKRFNKEEF